jgi:hypothetical protein
MEAFSLAGAKGGIEIGFGWEMTVSRRWATNGWQNRPSKRASWVKARVKSALA